MQTLQFVEYTASNYTSRPWTFPAEAGRNVFNFTQTWNMAQDRANELGVPVRAEWVYTHDYIAEEVIYPTDISD